MTRTLILLAVLWFAFRSVRVVAGVHSTVGQYRRSA